MNFQYRFLEHLSIPPTPLPCFFFFPSESFTHAAQSNHEVPLPDGVSRWWLRPARRKWVPVTRTYASGGGESFSSFSSCFLGNRLYVNHVWMEILTKTEDVNLLLKITFRFCFPPGPIFTLRERWKRKKHVHLGISLERVTTDNLQLFLLHWGGNPEARGEGWSWGPGGPSGPLLKGWLQARARVSASPLVLLFFFFKGRNWIFMSKSQYVNIFTSQMKQSRRNPRDHRVESMSLDLEAWGSEKEGTFQDDTRI